MNGSSNSKQHPTLAERIQRALNLIRKPSTIEEITDLVNRELGVNDRVFQPSEVESCLRNSPDAVLLYWSRIRPRQQLRSGPERREQKAS